MAHAATRGWGDPTTSTYRKKIVPCRVDNVQFNVHKDVEPIFRHFLKRLVAENNYSLDEVRDDWSYILRPIRGYESEWESTGDFRYLSNHSWGLAIDVNATKNPMRAKLVTDLPVDWVRANVKQYKLAWGGDYSGRKDAMHFEFMGTPKDARAIRDRLSMEATLAKLDAEDLGNIKKIVDAETNDIYWRILGVPAGTPNDQRPNLKDILDRLEK